MGSNADEVKGRAKEAAGSLTDNDSLKNEGKLDKASATAKEKMENIKDRVEDAIDSVKDRVSDKD